MADDMTPPADAGGAVGEVLAWLASMTLHPDDATVMPAAMSHIKRGEWEQQAREAMRLAVRALAARAREANAGLDAEGRLPIRSTVDPHYGHAMTPSGWRAMLERSAEELWHGRKMQVKALAQWMEEVLPGILARAREAEGLVSELRQARADYWEVQAALTEIKLLVPLDESTDGPKAGWAGVVERVRCFTQRAEREAADLRARCERLEGVLEQIAALPVEVEHHGCLPEAAWAKRQEIWESPNTFDRKHLVDKFAAIVREPARTIARAALARAAEPAGEGQ